MEKGRGRLKGEEMQITVNEERKCSAHSHQQCIDCIVLKCNIIHVYMQFNAVIELTVVDGQSFYV